MQASFVNELLDMLSEMRHQLAHQQRQIDSLKAETRGDLQQVWFALRQQAVAGAGARAVGALGRASSARGRRRALRRPTTAARPRRARHVAAGARAAAEIAARQEERRGGRRRRRKARVAEEGPIEAGLAGTKKAADEKPSSSSDEDVKRPGGGDLEEAPEAEAPS